MWGCVGHDAGAGGFPSHSQPPTSSPFISCGPRWARHQQPGGVCQGALRQGTGKERPKACGRSHSRGCSRRACRGTESKPEAFRASKKSPHQLRPRVPHVTCSSRVFSSRHLLGSCRSRGAAAWGMPQRGAVGSAPHPGEPRGSWAVPGAGDPFPWSLTVLLGAFCLSQS